MNIIGYVVFKPLQHSVFTTFYEKKEDAEKFKAKKDAEQPPNWPSEYKVCGLVEV